VASVSSKIDLVFGFGCSESAGKKDSGLVIGGLAFACFKSAFGKSTGFMVTGCA
jgi:hypothetical protein